MFFKTMDKMDLENIEPCAKKIKLNQDNKFAEICLKENQPPKDNAIDNNEPFVTVSGKKLSNRGDNVVIEVITIPDDVSTSNWCSNVAQTIVKDKVQNLYERVYNIVDRKIENQIQQELLPKTDEIAVFINEILDELINNAIGVAKQTEIINLDDKDLIEYKKRRDTLRLSQKQERTVVLIEDQPSVKIEVPEVVLEKLQPVRQIITAPEVVLEKIQPVRQTITAPEIVLEKLQPVRQIITAPEVVLEKLQPVRQIITAPEVDLEKLQPVRQTITAPEVVLEKLQPVRQTITAPVNELMKAPVNDKIKPHVSVKIEPCPFISNDMKENRDNFDKGWESLKNAKTTAERYRIIHQRWLNLSIPNPSKDLSYMHCSQQNHPQHSPPHFSQQMAFDQLPRRTRTVSCTSTYELEYNKLQQENQARVFDLICYQKQELGNLDARQSSQLQNLRRNHSFDHVVYQHTREYENLKNKHVNQLGNVAAQNQSEMRKLLDYVDEARSFYKFYQDLDPNDNTVKTQLNDEQLMMKQELDDLFSAYPNFYSQER